MHSSIVLSALGALLGASFSRSTTVLASQILNADSVLSQSYVAISSDAFLVRRQDEGAPSGSNDDESDGPLGLNLDGSFNASSWTNVTHAACQTTLSSLRRSPNPSGSSVCFNLPSLDASTGIFEADLRLYRVFPPSGPWEGVEPGDINVGVAFPNAEVDSIKEEDIQGMGLVGTVRGLVRRQGEGEKARPELIQSYMLVGRIKQDKMRPDMSMYVSLKPPNSFISFSC